MHSAELRVAELVSGRPPWATDEQFVHLGASSDEMWFWVDLAVDSDDVMRSALRSLAAVAADA